jgi:hypothetical protein
MSEESKAPEHAERKTQPPEQLLTGLASHIQHFFDASDSSKRTDLDLFVIALSITKVLFDLRGSMPGGSPILPVPDLITETARLSNRIVSFVLDDHTHFGTGVLVGPEHVLTAAHLFFEPETGRLIDRERQGRITVEVHTTLIDKIVVEGPRRKAHLYEPHTDAWLLDPGLKGDVAQRDVNALDFAIVRISERFGDDQVGGGDTRRWFPIPTAANAAVLADDLVLHVFEFLDRERLLTSIGLVRGVVENGMRVLHTASTLGSGSGAPIVNTHLNLVALHVGGPISGEVPRANRALPIRRVAEVIDRPLFGGVTIRSMLK